MINSWDRIGQNAVSILGLPAGSSAEDVLKKWWELPADDAGAKIDAELALNSGGEKSMLMTWSIGPVQGFIAQARRTADLWGGSMILSQLAGAAAVEICKELGPWAFAFPSMRGQPAIAEWLLANKICQPFSEEIRHIAALPNRFSVLVPGAGIYALTLALEEAVNREWKVIVESAINYIQKIHFEVVPEVIERQLRSQFNISWSAVKFEGDYKVINESAAKTFNAMRSGRPFNQIIEDGVKCSLCGERTSLNNGGEQDKKLWIELGNVDKKGFFRKSTKKAGASLERLCAVCLAKRAYPLRFSDGDAHSFPSTHEISLGNFRSLLAQVISDDTALQKKYDEFRKALIDADENNLLDEPALGSIQRSEVPAERGINATWFLRELPDNNGLDEKREDFKEQLKLFKVKYPTGYYAILLMDGDRVGRLLTGEGKKNVGLEYHSSFSSNLNAFALEDVPKAIASSGGYLVYAGGDDVLAFLPASKVLTCCCTIAEYYRERMSRFDIDDKNKATISAAILFPHALSPVGPLLNEAHRLLDEFAKHKLGRDALAFRVMQRNGTRCEGGFKFPVSHTSEGHLDWLAEIENVIKMLGTELGSTKLNSIVGIARELKLDHVSHDDLSNANLESHISTQTGLSIEAIKQLIKLSVSKSGIVNSKDVFTIATIAEVLSNFVLRGQTEALKLARFLVRESDYSTEQEEVGHA